MRSVLLLLMLWAVAPVAAQLDQRTVQPGMSRVQVVERLGMPVAERTVDDLTFLFYEADCGLCECEVDDLVVLQEEVVVDALLLEPYRVYTGSSTLERGPSSAQAGDGVYDAPWFTWSATPLLDTGQPGVAHGRDEAVTTPPGIPAGTTTVGGFSMPAPGTPFPEGLCLRPFVGAEPAPEDAARAAALRQLWIVQQYIEQSSDVPGNS